MFCELLYVFTLFCQQGENCRAGNRFYILKETVSVISSDGLRLERGSPDSQLYPSNLINDVQDNVVFQLDHFLILEIPTLFSCRKKCASHICKETTI